MLCSKRFFLHYLDILFPQKTNVLWSYDYCKCHLLITVSLRVGSHQQHWPSRHSFKILIINIVIITTLLTLFHNCKVRKWVSKLTFFSYLEKKKNYKSEHTTHNKAQIQLCEVRNNNTQINNFSYLVYIEFQTQPPLPPQL